MSLNTTSSSFVSNTSAASSSSGSNTALVISVLSYIDIVVRIINLLTHTSYVLVVLTHKELRTWGQAFMHNTNFIGLVLAVCYAAWINSTAPNIADPFWYGFVCTIVETIWGVVKYARAYSVLVLGIYRLIAVHFIKLYKRLSGSRIFIVLGCLAPWTVAGLVFALATVVARTTYGQVLCSDGFTTLLSDSIIYFLITTCLGYIVPIVLVVVLFMFVNRRLREMGRRLNKLHVKGSGQQAGADSRRLSKNTHSHRGDEHPEGKNSSSSLAVTFDTAKQKKMDHKMEKTLAFQFLCINTLELISAVALGCINLYLFIPNFNTTYYYMRQIFRITGNFCQSLIPVVTLMLHPFKFGVLARLRAALRGR